VRRNYIDSHAIYLFVIPALEPVRGCNPTGGARQRRKGVNDAQNKNESLGGETVQKDRIGKIRLFQITFEPHLDQKNNQA